MIGIQTELKLANLLKTISDGEKQIEIVRQVLAEVDEFEPYTAFKRIDRLTNGYLTSTDILIFLRENDILVAERDVDNLIKVYDSNADKRISYTDFLNMVLPNTNQLLRKMCTSRSSYYITKYDRLPYEVEWALARVFNKEIDFYRKIELLKEDLVSSYDWNIMDAFKLIDIERIGYLTHDNAYDFLKKNNVSCTDDDILALFRRLDKESKGKINYSNFVDGILPMYPPQHTINEFRKSYQDYFKPTSMSPVKKATKSLYHSPEKRFSNLDYLKYVSDSAHKASIRENIRPSDLGYSTRIYEPYKTKSEDIEREIRLSKSSMYQTPIQKIAMHDENKYTSPSKRRIESPLKDIEEEHLALMLKQQIDNERDLESVKNDLALKSDFNLLDAFRFFDVEGKGHINRAELEQGMKVFKIYPTNLQLYLLMRKYDIDSDSLLKYTEFCDMISPKSEEYASILAKRVPTYIDNERLDLIFSWETKSTFSNLLGMLVENEVNAEALRQKLNRRPLFNIYEAFKALDKNDVGYLGIDEFKDLLINHGIYVSSKDLLNLVSRYDKDQDGKVTYSEFIQEITPKSPSKMY